MKNARLAALTSATGLALILTACGGGGSTEAYCDVIADHKDEYLSVTSQGDPFSGLLAGAGTIGPMWTNAADAAPGDIKDDVELIRDVWNGDVGDDFITAASTMGEAIQAFGRVDTFTRDNCEAGGMLTN